MRDSSKDHVMPSDGALDVLRKAEMKAKRQYDGPLVGLTGSEACSLLRRNLDAPAPVIRMAALRACHMLLRRWEKEGCKAELVACLTEAGIVPCLVRELGNSEDVDMQLEATCMVAAIAAEGGPHAQGIVSSGAVLELRRLAESEHQSLRDQASLALRYI